MTALLGCGDIHHQGQESQSTQSCKDHRVHLLCQRPHPGLPWQRCPNTSGALAASGLCHPLGSLGTLWAKNLSLKSNLNLPRHRCSRALAPFPGHHREEPSSSQSCGCLSAVPHQLLPHTPPSQELSPSLGNNNSPSRPAPTPAGRAGALHPRRGRPGRAWPWSPRKRKRAGPGPPGAGPV